MKVEMKMEAVDSSHHVVLLKLLSILEDLVGIPGAQYIAYPFLLLSFKSNKK